MRSPVRRTWNTRTFCNEKRISAKKYISKRIILAIISQICNYRSLCVRVNKKRGTSMRWRFCCNEFPRMYDTRTRIIILIYKTITYAKWWLRVYTSQYKQLYNNSPFNRWHSLIHSDVLWTLFNGALPCLLLNKELPISIYECHIVAKFKHFWIYRIEWMLRIALVKSSKNSTYIIYIHICTSS